MARNDDSKRSPNAPSRVYKASDVHKRRVDRKGRQKKSPPVPEEDAPAKRGRHDDAWQDGAWPEGVSPDDVNQSKPDDDQLKEAVVIAPQFGRRTEAQRQADDRWFAAMRERDEAAFDAARPPSDGAPAPDDMQPQDRAGAGSGQPTREAGAEEAPASEASSERRLSSLPTIGVQGEPKPEPNEQPDSDAPPEARQHPSAQPLEEGPFPAEAEPAAEGQEPDGEMPKPRKAGRRKLPKKALAAIVIGVIVLVVAAVVSALFVWNRWYRFDDHADMQGEWYVVGTTVPVTIDEASIHLTNDVVYHYEINAHDKTISYSFGTMKGQGRYWFSDDRMYLVITDGDEFTGSSTAVDDLLHAFKDLTGKVSGAEATLPEGEGIIAFSREPDADALARQKKEAAEKAAAEAAARQEAERRAAEEAAAAEAEYYGYDEAYVEEPASEPVQEPEGEPAPANEPPADGQAPQENQEQG